MRGTQSPMALEAASYISQLVPANPPASDPIAQSANHLNLIKTVLQTTFPHASVPLSATMERLNNGTPVGLIAMWSGAALPAGWTLCNGVAVARMDGTGSITPPDLRDRFVLGAGLSFAFNSVGGAGSVTLATAQLPSHTHGVTDNGHVHGVTDNGHGHAVNDNGHTHGIPVSGGSGGLGFSEPGSFNGNYVSSTNAQSGIGIAAGNSNIAIQGAGSNISIQAAGGGAPVPIVPPYYAIAFIMKV